MKLSDYVAAFLAQQGIRHAFAIAGGACLHLIDSIAARTDIAYVCPHHEQAAAMAADAYSRVSERPGVAITTSGPGATNLITGICCAYYDSVPVLFITGQVATFRLKQDTGVRQFGFQETDIVGMCRSVTKYAVMVEDPLRIRYELEKAVALATSGRPGPVLVDIPDDLQRRDIDPGTLEGYSPPPPASSSANHAGQAREALALLRRARRPIVILGWGIHLANAAADAVTFLRLSGLPVVPTWGAIDLVAHTPDNFVGTFGLHGTRYGNFAVQNSDCILAIGTRLDTHETGSPLSSFAREARKIIVDIDRAELTKFPRFGMPVDLPIEADAGDFLRALSLELPQAEMPDITPWRLQIAEWQREFEICPASNFNEPTPNPYAAIKALSRAAAADGTVVIDTGCVIAWFMQAWEPRPGQRIFSALNNTPMGYALPGAIGASFALDRATVLCLIGDGGLMMNIQELATIMHHALPIKIIVFNNRGYSMIQQTQDQWLGSRYHASSKDGGLSFPDFVEVARAHGIPAARIDRSVTMPDVIAQALAHDGPFLCDLTLDPAERVVPQVVYGRPIEDAGPLLSRDLFLRNMLVKPLDISLLGE
ncbi:MAG: thiamine pyrophosphate-binding protein [Planctomycetota bacterium]